MANKSIETIQSLIDQAQANLEGVVQWQGEGGEQEILTCLLYTSPSPRDYAASRMPSSA